MLFVVQLDSLPYTLYPVLPGCTSRSINYLSTAPSLIDLFVPPVITAATTHIFALRTGPPNGRDHTGQQRRDRTHLFPISPHAKQFDRVQRVRHL